MYTTYGKKDFATKVDVSVYCLPHSGTFPPK